MTSRSLLPSFLPSFLPPFQAHRRCLSACLPAAWNEPLLSALNLCHAPLIHLVRPSVRPPAHITCCLSVRPSEEGRKRRHQSWRKKAGGKRAGSVDFLAVMNAATAGRAVTAHTDRAQGVDLEKPTKLVMRPRGGGRKKAASHVAGRSRLPSSVRAPKFKFIPMFGRMGRESTCLHRSRHHCRHTLARLSRSWTDR